MNGWNEYESVCRGNSIFNISGGEVWGLHGRDNMVINVSGGRIDDFIDIANNSILNVSVGEYINLNGFMNGQIHIAGGQYDNIFLTDQSLLQLRNGVVGALNVSGNGYAILEGGIVNELVLKQR